MNVKIMLGALLAVSLLAANAYAKDYTVKELNTGAAGTFVFEPDFLHIQPGDSVHFVAADAGHDSQSFLVPAGAQPWKSEVSKDITVKFTKDGVYLYECNPHHLFGMQGVVVVGKAVNKEAAEKAAKAMEAQQLMNKDRLEKLMQQVK
ncbi:MAG: pseudoazurin [Gammaproteobacteria bacterium]|nr:pseudoazurin [Gammaproteobacteria bacterium]MBU6508911.1 pseudoazurin [Gammaproteobacteria bacterium]MDE1983341.1 pseudoazurin [Gammaproteobacteria bacterium]MDE2108966.1 pseudoazurin [Gammaproteobacteria bacterium]